MSNAGYDPAQEVGMAEKMKRLNVPVEEERLDRWTRQAKAAGYSTLSEYVRRVLDGREIVKVEADEVRR